MYIQGHRIWIILFAGVLIVSGYLFYTVNINQQRVDEQSIRSLELTRNNLLEGWSYITTVDSIYDLAQYEDDAEWAKVFTTLFEQRRPSQFFDRVILTDSAGSVLVSSPDDIDRQIPIHSSDPDTLGIVQADMHISLNNYKTFRIPVTIRAKEREQNDSGSVELKQKTLYLFGAVDKVKFNEAGRQISFSLIYMLFTLVILIIVSYPILRILGMGTGDILLRSHVYQVGVSLLLLAVFIGFSISYWTSRGEIMEDQHDAIERVSENVLEAHKEKLTNQMNVFSSFQNDGVQPAQSPSYNEIFTINADGKITWMRTYQPDNDPQEVNTDTLQNVKNRYYFRRAAADKFFLGSHFSYSGGILEGVLSKRVHTRNSDQADSVSVRAITFSFSDLEKSEDSLNPRGLKYLLINPSGEVYYQSPSIETDIAYLKNGINAEKWNEIKTLMEGNSGINRTLQVSIMIDGQSYIAHLKEASFSEPLLSEPLWMLTLRDRSVRYFRSYSIFLYSLTGYAILVSVYLLIFLFGWFSRKSSYYLKLRPFFYSWFRPSYNKRKNYGVLLGIILLHVAYYFFLFMSDTHNFWFITFLFCEVILFIALCRYLLLSDFLVSYKDLNRWVFPGMVSLAIFLFFLILFPFITLGNKVFWELTSLGALQLICLVVILFPVNITFISDQITSAKLGGFIHSHSSKRALLNHNRLYACTIAIWLLLTGIVPGYMIHHTAFHYEDNLWNNAVRISNHFSQERKQHENENSEHESSITFSNRQADFINQLEYHRRQWLENYSGIDYPVVDRYIYSPILHIENAFSHDQEVEHLHDKALASRIGVTGSYFIFGLLLYFLAGTISRRVFLTQYWDFDRNIGLSADPGMQTYLIALDNEKAVTYLKDQFLEDKSYRIYDLSSPAGRGKIDKLKNSQLLDADGYILMNIEPVLQNEEDLSNLIDLIYNCSRSNKFVVLTGSKSMKKLRDIYPPGADVDMEAEEMEVSWTESLGSFISIIIPIDYGTNTENSSGSHESSNLPKDLIREVKYGPHTEALRKLLENELDVEDGSKPEAKKIEKLLLMIQRYNKAYYQKLWDKLTFREKQIAWNYASEGFINHRNLDHLSELLQKGIFRMDWVNEEISLFNRSFRNFAAGAVSPKLKRKFKKDKKENGNISNLRNALLTFIFLAILGVSLLAPELLDRYIGALSGVLAILSSTASLAKKYSLDIPFLKNS